MWLILAAAGLVGVAAGGGAALVHRGSAARQPALAAPAPPIVSWPAGKRRAPGFRLHDENGAPVSLSGLRGRVVILTFIDPLCRNLCPLEAHVINKATTGLPAGQRPAVVSVSVNQWGNSRIDIRLDNQKWRLGSDWRWAIGAPAALARTWRQYAIGVSDEPRTIDGVTIHNIVHTEAAYVIDRQGFERALFIYPFTAADLARTVRGL